MRIDAHQHFWQYDPQKYGWISDAMAPLKNDFLPHDLAPLLQRTGIDGTIAVQATQSLEETDWLLALAAQDTFIRGVVGWVDLQSAQVHNQLEHYAQQPKLCGIRHIVQDELDDRFMLQPAFLHAISLLQQFNLVYDLLLYPKHLPIAVDVVRQFPQQRFVLDHLAKPPIKAGSVSPWDDDIRALARFDNVFCKISGMVTEAAWQKWKLDDFKRYLDVVFDCFGPDRLMFGSDWPVCTLSGSYAEVLLIVQAYMRGLSSTVQEQVLGGNAVHVYGLADA